MFLALLSRRCFHLLQVFLGVFRRALCCFRRRRRNSRDEDELPFININVESNNSVDDGQENWDRWGEPVTENPVEQHIKMYRQQRANLNMAKTEEEPKEDFFLDMTPRIVKQKKLYLPNEKTEENAVSSLSLAPDPVFNSPDLGVWEESQQWEAEGDGDVDVMDVLREQKRQEREKRFLEQQRRKHERVRDSVGS